MIIYVFVNKVGKVKYVINLIIVMICYVWMMVFVIILILYIFVFVYNIGKERIVRNIIIVIIFYVIIMEFVLMVEIFFCVCVYWDFWDIFVML